MKDLLKILPSLLIVFHLTPLHGVKEYKMRVGMAASISICEAYKNEDRLKNVNSHTQVFFEKQEAFRTP